MGGVDIITLLLFKFYFWTTPCEETLKEKDNLNEEHIIDKLTKNLSYQYEPKIAYTLA